VPRRTVVFVLFAIVMAAICVRLGFWQLSRRRQRLAMNARIESRIGAAAVPIATLTGDTSAIRFRQAHVEGVPDYDHEIALTLRGNNGSPGVDLITPIRVAGEDSAVLVNRGWAYSPDGMTVDFSKLHDRDSAFTGYVDVFDASGADSLRGRGISRMSYEAIARTMPYPVKRVYLVAIGDSAGGGSLVVRLRLPRLDSGPHLSYAIQWFGFATVALIGAAIVAARTMRLS
jgi:surfeit locus 1 family protein